MTQSELEWLRALAHGPNSKSAEAAAAAMAVAASGLDGVSDWLALFRLLAEAGRWSDALEAAKAAAGRHADSAEAALLLPQALGGLHRTEEEQRGYETVQTAFPENMEVHDRLAHLAWRGGDFACVHAQVKRALELGLRGRDHLVELGTAAAMRIARFDEARTACAYIESADWRRRTLDVAEREWEAAAWIVARDYHDQVSLETLEQLLSTGQHDLARHAAVRLLQRPNPPKELKFLIHRMHALGPSGWYLSQWAGFKGARDHPEDPDILWSVGADLLARGDFSGAASKLLALTDSKVPSEVLLRLLLLTAAGGGATNEELQAATARIAQRGARNGAFLLVQSFLRRRGRPWEKSGVELENCAGGLLPLPSTPGHGLRRFYRSPGGRRRIAVCMAGQLRGFRQTWPGTQDALAGWDTTVFVSTWHEIGAGVGSSDIVFRLLPPTVVQRLPDNLLRRSTFEGCFPNVFNVMMESSSVTREELVQTFDTPFVRLHDEREFERDHCEARPTLQHRGDYNQAKMFFTMSDANATKAAHELEHGFVFDAVLRLRPDRQLSHLAAVDVERAIEHRMVSTDYLYPGGVGDQIMLSSSEIADLYGDVWRQLQVHGHSTYLPGASGLWAEHLLAHGVDVGLFGATRAGPPKSAEASLAALWTALLEDLPAVSVTAEARAIVISFCEAATEDAERGVADHSPLEPAEVERWRLRESLSPRAWELVTRKT